MAGRSLARISTTAQSRITRPASPGWSGRSSSTRSCPATTRSRFATESGTSRRRTKSSASWVCPKRALRGQPLSSPSWITPRAFARWRGDCATRAVVGVQGVGDHLTGNFHERSGRQIAAESAPIKCGQRHALHRIAARIPGAIDCGACGRNRPVKFHSL